MSRAVPVMRVDSARVVRGRHYFILVDPAQSVYWTWFKMRYPYWERVALEYGAKSIETHCPEFDSFKSLINWLFDVLVLPQGERNLLLLLGGREC